MSDNQYKTIDNKFRDQIRSDLEANMEKFKDPVVLGELVFRLLEERENTNRLLKNMYSKIEQLEAKLESRVEPKEQMSAKPSEETLLPQIDSQIVDFVRESGKATAEDVQHKFNYKGKNGACARLNRLCDMNFLQKKQVGKKVFFMPTSY